MLWNQGFEYLDIGRFWQILPTVGPPRIGATLVQGLVTRATVQVPCTHRSLCESALSDRQGVMPFHHGVNRIPQRLKNERYPIPGQVLLAHRAFV